jgi:hypothetical protein
MAAWARVSTVDGETWLSCGTNKSGVFDTERKQEESIAVA